MLLYNLKPPRYYSECRSDLINLIPMNATNKVLELGAGTGETLVKIKDLGLADYVVGIDRILFSESGRHHDKIDRFIIGDIESMEVEFPKCYFDVIVAGDVLEHLFDPWKALARWAEYLKRDGVVIMSIPNFREVGNLWRIAFRGDFEYTDSGIMDKTHVRFFCKRNIIDLCKGSLLKVIKISSDLQFKTKGRRVMFNKFTCGIFSDFLVSQYYIVAQRMEKQAETV